MARYLIAALLLFMEGACATPSIGRGGPVYEVIIHSVDDRPTALRGHAGYPACTIQVGDHAARVWLSSEASADNADSSPTLLRADAAALAAGVLIESSWDAAVVHAVTEEELAVEAATVHVPFA